MPVRMLRLSFSFLFQALLGDIPPVMSHHCCLLVHVVQVAEGCRGLKLPQTAPSTGLPTFPSEKKTTSLSSSCGLRQGHESMQSLPRHPMLAMAVALALIAPRAKWKHTA